MEMQDAGEFNIATSSLHALSNNMTSSTHSSDKHSPHTSPRFSRRSTTPSLMAVQNDLYAGHVPTLSLAGNATANYISAATALTGVGVGGGNGVGQHPPPSAPPMSVVNGNNQTTATAVPLTSVPSQKSTNRMSAPLIGSNAVIVGYGTKMSGKIENTDNSSSSYAILQNLQESKESHKRESNISAAVAPPLPPRKSSPGAGDNNISTPTTVHTNGSVSGGNGVMQRIPSLPQTSKSVDNIAATLGDISVPKTTAPPIPPHNIMTHIDTLVDELRNQRITNPSMAANVVCNSSTSTPTTLMEDDIVGPAETITGVIDTRPLEARSAASLNYTQLCTTTTTSTSNNLRDADLKTNNDRSSIEATKTTSQHQQQRSQPLLYENISINQKGDCTVPYENINLEYIARLMNEGYSKENAITALGISRNNIEMACDILREFVAKNSV